ncbi:MAG: ParA family protein [Bacteroidales bacterium]|nr:ParA family protein [Candidatus Scybalousia scybalohippi]
MKQKEMLRENSQNPSPLGEGTSNRGIFMKIFACALSKGGTGKTSCAATIAVELSRLGKTLLVDVDPQGNATSWLGGESIESELADVLFGHKDIKQAIYQTAEKNLFILPTAGLNGQLREYQQNKSPSEPFAFTDMLETVKDIFEYCIIDTSPAFTSLEKSAINSADEVIAILQLDEFSADGFQIFSDNLKSMKKQLHIPAEKALLKKIVLNSKDNRLSQQKVFYEDIIGLKEYGYEIFTIPVDQAFKKAQQSHISIQQTGSAKPETLLAFKQIAESLSK